MKKNLPRNCLLLAAVLFFIVCNVGAASAASESLDEADLWTEVAENIDVAPGDEAPKDSARKWALSIGMNGGFSPDYEGSNNYSFDYSPNIAASWRDTIFYKGKTLGVNLVRQKKLKAGLTISQASGRSEDDNDRLKGLGDVDGSIEAGGFITYRKKPYRFKADVRQDIGSGHEGALVALSSGRNLPFESLPVAVELGATWASANYMSSFFGVDAQQSLDSGLKRHNADAGIKDIKISMTAGYEITTRWRIGGTIVYKRLVGDAADSPIVDDKNQFLAGLSLSYHMGSKILPEELK